MSDVVDVHKCPPGTAERYTAVVEDAEFASAYGGLIDDLAVDEPTYLLAGERAYGLSVNGGEYRGPIFFCPWCGAELVLPPSVNSSTDRG